MIFGFEGWVTNWYFQIIVLEKTLQSSLDSKVTKPVNLKGNQLWIFVGRTNPEDEAPILWPPDVKRKRPHWKRLWWWERLRARGGAGNRGWGGWMASLTQWTWVWVNSGRRWRTGRPGVLQFIESESDTTWQLNDNNNNKMKFYINKSKDTIVQSFQ